MSRTLSGGPDGRSFDRIDRVGVALLAGAVGWTLVSAALAEGNPWPMVGSLVAAAVGVAVGRLVDVRGPLLIPVAVLLLLGGMLVADGRAIVAGSARAGPLGYPNAVGALFVQGAAAGLMIASVRPSGILRAAGVAAAAACVLVPAAAGSLAAVVTAGLLFPAAIVVLRRAGVRPVILGGGLVAAAAVSVTVGIAAVPEAERSSLLRPLDDRPLLWSEALGTAVHHPLAGVGPGRFAEVSPTARSDRDLRWAHHEYLQAAAETGFIGGGLLLVAFGWGFWRLWASPSPAAGPAAAGLAALAANAAVDYVLHFPLLLGVAGLLVGSASAGMADSRSPEAGEDPGAGALVASRLGGPGSAGKGRPWDS